MSSASEWVKIVFSLQQELPGVFYDLQDVIAAINLGFTDPAAEGSLRIGLHVRGIDGGPSDSFVMVPVPAAALLGLLGLGAAGLRLRKYM